MKISYNKLWKLMIDRKTTKGELRKAIGVSKGTFAKLGRDESVSVAILLRICEYLRCDFSDIIEAVSSRETREDDSI